MTWKEQYPNFTEAEVSCKCCGVNGIDPDALSRLQELRTKLDRALTVNSAFRCVSWNTKVGGGERSQHLFGRAFDISVDEWTDEEKLDLLIKAKEVGFDGFGYYTSFLHVDTGPERFWNTPWSADNGE